MYHLLCVFFVVAIVQGYGPWASYQTEPGFRSSIFTIHHDANRTAIAPGYIFLTNYISDISWPSFGPQIYTMDGDLIWNGNDTAHVRALDAHVCDYQGERGTHLCMNDAIPVEQPGHSSGAIRFFDNSYEQVGDDFGAAGGFRGPDSHELNTPRFGTRNSFLQDIYVRKEMNLSIFSGPENGFILDGCFQEIDQTTRNVTFQWCASDHVDVSETFVYQNRNPHNYSVPIAGDGSKNEPWDWFHINAIDKNEEGDYLVSGRHTNTIYKVAGNQNNLALLSGEIVWRLGGKNSDFKLDNFNFSRQHDARFHKTTKSRTMISIFNNAFDGWNHTAAWSEGQLISLDNKSMTANMVIRYVSPDHQRSLSQGSVQFTQSNTTFIGWGNRPFVSEHDDNGTLLYYAQFSGHVESFRSWKFPWIGKPKTSPKLLGYALDVESRLYGYVSWNGATEVNAWVLYTSHETSRGPWTIAGRVPKSGFETFVNFTKLASPCDHDNNTVNFHPFMFAEALDASGAIIGTSPVVETFIPDKYVKGLFDCSETLCSRCTNMTEQECDDSHTWFSYDADYSQAWRVERSCVGGFYTFVLLVVAWELVSLVFDAWLGSVSSGSTHEGISMNTSRKTSSGAIKEFLLSKSHV